MKADLWVWKEFILHPSVFCRKFADFDMVREAPDIEFFTDSSGNPKLGGGSLCGKEWFFVGWNEQFLRIAKPSIEYLELYSLTAGILLWIHKFHDSKVNLFCDNKAVVSMVNNCSSKCRNCMVLIRLIVLQCLKFNVVVRVKYVRSGANARADAISRRKFELFHQLSQYKAQENPQKMPDVLIPMSKIWIF